jgi:hypothetical protein
MPLAAEEKEEYRLLSMSSSGLSCFRFLFVVERCMEEASVRAARWIVEQSCQLCKLDWLEQRVHVRRRERRAVKHAATRRGADDLAQLQGERAVRI